MSSRSEISISRRISERTSRISHRDGGGGGGGGGGGALARIGEHGVAGAVVKEGWLLKKGGGGSDGNERNWAKVVV